MCRPLSLSLSLLFLLLLRHKISAKRPSGSSACVFPEAHERPFFFDIRSDTAPRSIVLDTVVEPPDAAMAIANIRSDNLPLDQKVGERRGEIPMYEEFFYQSGENKFI